MTQIVPVSATARADNPVGIMVALGALSAMPGSPFEFELIRA